MSAISHIGASYSQNAHDLPSYYAALDAGRLPVARGLELNDDDIIRADAIGLLMCQGRLDIAAFEARHNVDFQLYFDAELRRLRKLARDDLIEIAPESLQVTARGRYLLRHIAMCFDAYLAREATPAVRYSRAL
jgi:oxygen-independent coproporphyrinogen-3 oxidase